MCGDFILDIIICIIIVEINVFGNNLAEIIINKFISEADIGNAYKLENIVH